MTVQSFVPTLWSRKLLKNLNNKHVYMQCCNKDYEGEIGDVGSSVKINSLGRVTTFDYTRNTELTAAEVLDTASQALVIEKARAFHFLVDDIDKKQAAGDFMSEAMSEAAWSLAEDADDYIGAVIAAGVASANTLTAGTLGVGAGQSSAYDVLELMSLTLDESNTPEDGRWAVIPPWVHSLIRLDERFIGFNTDAAQARLRGAPIGMAAGFMLYKSNNVVRDSAEYVLLGGYKGAVTFAEQIKKTKAYEPEKGFLDAVKGLHVYGAKVTRPINLVRYDATRGTIVES